MNRMFNDQGLFSNCNRLDILDVMVDSRQYTLVQALSDKLDILGGGVSGASVCLLRKNSKEFKNSKYKRI